MLSVSLWCLKTGACVAISVDMTLRCSSKIALCLCTDELPSPVLKSLHTSCRWVVIQVQFCALVVCTVCDQAFVAIPYGGSHRSLWRQDLIVICNFGTPWFLRRSLYSLVVSWCRRRYIWRYKFCMTEILWRMFNNGC